MDATAGDETTTAPTRIKRRKLSDEAALQIESMIREGRYPPGSLLPSERELMASFGVGRTSIREALFALNRMGLVQVRNGERPRVTKPTPDRLIEELSGAVRYFLAEPEGARSFQEARQLFESAVARLAAQRRTQDDLARLRKALEANAEARGDVQRFERTDVAFHYVLANITRNPVLVAVHNALVGWLTHQRTLALRHPDAERFAFEDHRRIYKAVENKDPDAAGKSMEVHLVRIARFIASLDEFARPVAKRAQLSLNASSKKTRSIRTRPTER